MQRQNFAPLLRFSIVLCLSLLVVVVGGLIKPEAAVQTVSIGPATDFGTGSKPESATASTAAQFSQQGPKLVGTGAVGNAAQGSSVSLSADGNTAIVGAQADNSGAGAAWVWTRNGGVWTQQGPKLVGSGAVGIAGQGISVALSADGNTAIVGGGNDNGAAGAAWVWTRNAGVWTQQGPKLVGSGAVGNASQAFVSLSADGNTAIVGGYNDDGGAGAAWVWTRNGGAWNQQGPKLVGSGAVGNAIQGYSVSISGDGNTAIVGGWGDNSGTGAAWVWTRSGGVWTQQGTKLVGSGAQGEARQGRSVSLSDNGNTAIVGGYTDNGDVGAAWVWTRSGGVWIQQGPKLVGTGGARPFQGVSASLSADANTAIVGGEIDSGSRGATWVWTRSGGVWTQHGPKLVGSGAVGEAFQGGSVALSADANTAIVGGYGDNSGTGAAWVFTASQCGTLSFAAATNFAVGTIPLSAAVGDFNSDAKLDLAVANQISSDVSVLLGTGGGSFGAATNFTVGIHPAAVAVGDFNGDSNLDIVTANSDSSFNYSVSVLLGNGVGSFLPATNMSFGSPPLSVAVGDFNSDGKLDLAVGNGSSVMLLLGNGSGGFAFSGVFAAGVTPGSVAVADFNSDGKLDLAVANLNSSNVSLLLGNGGGGFAPATNFSVGTTPYSIGVGDFNADGRSDLAVVNRDSNNISVLLGNVGGGFAPATNFAVGAQPRSVAVADLNADGKLDLTVANHDSSNVSTLLGNGTGSFALATNFAVGSGPASVVAGNLNDDGKLDLAVANSNSDTVSILLNNCSNTSPSITEITPAVPARSGVDQSVAVNGSGFHQNLSVTLTFPSGASTTFNGPQIQNVTPNSFTLLTTLNASGSWSLRVNNPDGGQSNTFSFNVGSGPLISSISPPSPVASSNDQNIPVFGSGFQPNLSVSVTFPNGTGTTLSGPGQIQNVTPTSFTMVIALNATGTWRIRVNNPIGSSQSNTYSFTVRASAPTIDDINPDPVMAGVNTALIVSGINFRTGFSASVTTPDGTFDISSSQLTFITSTEIRVPVTMHGTPPYQATLRIFYSNGQSTTGTFQVQGPSSTGPLTGTIGIWDGQKVYKLRGASVTLQVHAKLSSNPNAQPIDATVTDSQYLFASNSFQPNTDYDIYVDLEYDDVISPVINGLSPCISSNSVRTSRLVKRGHRASTSSSQLLDFDFKPPLVMVHGLGNCFRKWHNNAQDNPNLPGYTGNDPNYWESYARSLGFITLTPSYDWVINSNSGNGFNDWESRASDVATQITNNLVSLTGNGDYPPWIYIGHSMGGLIGRVLTNKTDNSIRPLVRKLRKMYELGTPNSGSYLTRGVGNSVVEYLSPPYVRKTFNLRYDGFGFFSAGLVKAYAGNQCGVFGDCVVLESDVAKIIARFEIPLFPDYETTLLTLPTESLHFHHLELGSSDSRDCILNNRVLPEVCQMPSGRNPGATVGPCPITSTTCNPVPLRPGRTDKTQTNGGSSTQAAVITSKAVLLASDQTTTIPFTVSSTDSILANGFIASGSASFSLINPSGQVIDFASLPPSAGEHMSGDSGEIFLLSNPVPGSWSFRAIAGSSGASISMIAAENSPLGFQGFVDLSIFNGQTAHLTGKWLGTSTGIASPSVIAQVIDPAGAPVVTVNLLDDGNHGDGNAGDGIFGGDTPVLSTTGGYSIVFTAQGSLNGVAFERWAEAALDVVSPTHAFTGSFNDAALDSDLNGTYDEIRETVEISVASAGGYLVSADLCDAQGYFISHAVGYTQATAGGVYSVDLDFSVSGAFCTQFGSPFMVKNLTLSDAGLLTVLDVYTENPTTQTYDGSLFGCANGTPSPSISTVQPSSIFPGGSGQVLIGGNSFQNGAQVSFGAGVNVSSVTFGGSTTLIAQVSVSPGATAGPRDVTVTNPDGHPATAVALFNVASDQPPSVSMNNLADQQIVNGIVTVSATATDDLGVQTVEFYIDGVLSGTDTSFPYQLLWDTTSLSNGTHTLAGKAYDTANQTSQQQITVIVSCISSYAPTSQSFLASGGNGTINVTATGGCSWTAISNAPWLMITSGGGSGSGPVGFSVDANTLPSRIGTLTLAAQTFTVTQDSGCSFSLGAPGQTFGSEGGSGSVNVTCGAGCLWTATSNDSWIAITSNPSGSGNGSVDYSVDTNPTGTPRTGTMTIAGQTFTVDQGNNPTAVNLESFTATGYDSGVFIEWRTGLEVENLGFHVYREQAGQRVRITPEIVAGSALIAGNKTTLTAGNSYAWFDAVAKDKQDAQYWLEDIDIDGKSTLHGPITPKRIIGQPAEQSSAALLSRIGKGETLISQLAFHQMAGPSQKQVDTQWDLAGEPAIKLTIRDEGWYRVTQPELIAAGLDPKTDPRNLQLYLKGAEQAMLVAGEQNGSLDQDDAIEFYASGQDVPSTDALTYWVVSGKQPGKRIIVIRSDAKPGGATSFSYTVERKERTIYFASLKNGDAENFFGRVITSQFVDQELKLQHLDRTSQADSVLEVALQGVTDLPGLGPDHQVKVTLNGASVGTMIFDGRQHPVERFSVPHSLLKEGDNVVTLVAEGGPSDISLVDFIRLTYQHAYTADHDALRMTVRETKQAGPIAQQSQTIDGFTNASIQVIDVTNPDEPQELKGRIEERKRGGFAVTVQLADSAARTLIAFTSDHIGRPASIAVNQASNWRDKAHSADLLIITHRTFAGSLAPLTALRQKQGFAVETVDVEDIYDEFSFGEKSPQAIRDFLAFVHTSWKLAPRFVLFAGDASFDPRNYLGAGDFDLVPTKLIDTTYLETASDDWFADFNDDGLPEMYLGRLPVRTPAEAAVIVSKIVNYDLVNPKLPTAKESVLLIADRNDGFDFEAASHRLTALIPSGITAQEIFRGRLDDATAKKQVIDAIGAGQTVVNYTGHGSTNVWRNLLTTSDIQSLNNQQKLSLFVSMTCLNGFFQEPVTESLAEGLLKSARGGAIAVWASSGLAEPAQQALMNQQAYRLLFAGGSGLTIGEVTSRAKASVSNIDIRRTWLLFGDPTTRLK